jgi:hypothetical protein
VQAAIHNVTSEYCCVLPPLPLLLWICLNLQLHLISDKSKQRRA